MPFASRGKVFVLFIAPSVRDVALVFFDFDFEVVTDADAVGSRHEAADNLLSTASCLPPKTSASASTSKSNYKKLRPHNPTEGAIKRTRTLPRDANGKIIRPPVLPNNVNSKNKGE